MKHVIFDCDSTAGKTCRSAEAFFRRISKRCIPDDRIFG